MDVDGAVIFLAATLKRAVQRLENLRVLAEDRQPGDAGKLSAELRDALMDVCQLTIALCMIDADVREIATRVVRAHSSIKDGRPIYEIPADVEKRIQADVEKQIQQTVVNSDAIKTLQRELDEIQRQFCKLQEDAAVSKNRAEAAQSLSLVSIVLR